MIRIGHLFLAIVAGVWLAGASLEGVVRSPFAPVAALAIAAGAVPGTLP